MWLSISFGYVLTTAFFSFFFLPAVDFISLMASPIVHDSQAHTKLDLIATILPDKLCALFEAVQKKIPEITSAVKLFRKKHNMYNEREETWTLDGIDDITITKNISVEETNIALLICLLDARFAEVRFIGCRMDSDCLYAAGKHLLEDAYITNQPI